LALNKAKEENRVFDKKFGKPVETKAIPMLFTGIRSDRRIVREIKGMLTGKTTHYEDENGSWIEAGTDYCSHGVTIKSPATEEFEAMQALSFPYAPSCGS
jgi:hypothetical protein